MGYIKRLPRDKRILSLTDPEVYEEFLELFKTLPASWELYYSDSSLISGTTQEEWDAAPVDDVQILVWKTTDHYVHLVYGLNVYTMGGVEKYGKWMSDPEFFRIRDEVPVASPLMNGFSIYTLETWDAGGADYS